MPRRRTAKASTKRPSPQVPEGDEGKDLDVDLRKEKVRALISDFKTEVDSRIINLRTGVAELLNHINLAYTMELMKIPMEQRNMKLADFLKMGGNFEVVKGGEMESKVESLFNTNTLSSQPLMMIQESDDAEMATAKATRRRKRAADKAAMPPPTTRTGRSKAVCETPSTSQSALAWGTPLITPKFDVRLYQTPAIQLQSRVPKPGEVILSVDGSPLQNIHPPVDNAKVFTVLEDPESIQSAIDALCNMKSKLNDGGDKFKVTDAQK